MAFDPLPLVAAIAVVSLLVLGFAVGPRLRLPYLAGLGVLLAGYAFYGRAFAYIGVAPVFIGEVALGAGVIVVLGSAAWPRLLRSPIAWLTAALAVWCALRTFPFIGRYGIEALRDGATWGYAAFAFIVALLLSRADLDRALHGYGRLAMWFPAVAVVMFAVSSALGDSAPTLPWEPGVIVTAMKMGDVGVHVGGAAAFVLLGLGAQSGRHRHGALWWSCWLAALAAVMASSRGGFLAAAMAVGCAAMAGGVVARRQITRLAFAASLVAVAALSFPMEENVAGIDGNRRVTPRQLMANVTSIAGSVGYGSSGGGFVNLDETREWRLEWWSDIVGYTFGGDYFLQGKGFGVNLADDDGYQVEDEVPLRSPHNIHMTYLARGGVPGFLLWIALNVTFAWTLLRARRDALAYGQERWAALYVWVIAYWGAILVNATFDVYLEGPAGGIWYWAVIGFGIAAIELGRRERAAMTSGARLRLMEA